MADSDQENPGPLASIRRLLAALGGVVRTRVELLAVELEEQQHRLIELQVLMGAALVLGILSLVLFSAVFIFVFREDLRLYAAAGLGVLYLAGVVALVCRIKRRLRGEPFPDTIAQVRKDCECLIPPP